MASDVAQLFVGRSIGRHKLSPVVSPKKTVEGAVAGVVAAAIVLPALAHWWLPPIGAWRWAVIGTVIGLLGIAGDLFESLLKRSAGVKDSSALIPGHGGMLDRIDALLFSVPMLYVALRALGK
jgi:phosphatidate cytidylyltransferase